MARRRPKDPAGAVTVLCTLGTLAHNRAFTPGEVQDYIHYGGSGRINTSNALALFLRRGWLRRVEGRRLYPTGKGWRAIEIACGLRRHHP